MADNFQEQIDLLRTELTDLREHLDLAEILDCRTRKLGTPINDAKWVALPGTGKFLVSCIYRCECSHLHKTGIDVPAMTKDGGIYSVQGPCGQTTAIQVYRFAIPAKPEIEAPREQTPEEKLRSYSKQ